ncbi:MAG: hypothetical protein AB7D57_11825 [Desulfovibrionaceae bacterium]
MNEYELVRDCLGFFSSRYGLDRVPRQALRVRVLVPEADDLLDDEDGAWDPPVTPSRRRKVLVYGLAAALLLALAGCALAGWPGWALFWLAWACLALSWTWPGCLVVVREAMTLDADGDPAPAMARAVALAFYNEHPVREFLHVLLDLLLLPLLLSCQEGVAVWAERRYCAARGLEGDPATRSLRGRLSAPLLLGLERLFGPRLPAAVLRWL